MFDLIKIREEISDKIDPIRPTLTPGCLLRIHPDRVAQLAIEDKSGDILILFPSERVTDKERTFEGFWQTRVLNLLLLINLPNYYSETGAGIVSQKLESSLIELQVSDSLFPIEFDRRAEYTKNERWILEVYFEITGKFFVSKEREIVPKIEEVNVSQK